MGDATDNMESLHKVRLTALLHGFFCKVKDDQSGK